MSSERDVPDISGSVTCVVFVEEQMCTQSERATGERGESVPEAHTCRDIPPCCLPLVQYSGMKRRREKPTQSRKARGCDTYAHHLRQFIVFPSRCCAFYTMSEVRQSSEAFTQLAFPPHLGNCLSEPSVGGGGESLCVPQMGRAFPATDFELGPVAGSAPNCSRLYRDITSCLPDMQATSTAWGQSEKDMDTTVYDCDLPVESPDGCINPAVLERSTSCPDSDSTIDRQTAQNETVASSNVIQAMSDLTMPDFDMPVNGHLQPKFGKLVPFGYGHITFDSHALQLKSADSTSDILPAVEPDTVTLSAADWQSCANTNTALASHVLSLTDKLNEVLTELAQVSKQQSRHSGQLEEILSKLPKPRNRGQKTASSAGGKENCTMKTGAGVKKSVGRVGNKTSQ